MFKNINIKEFFYILFYFIIFFISIYGLNFFTTKLNNETKKFLEEKHIFVNNFSCSFVNDNCIFDTISYTYKDYMYTSKKIEINNISSLYYFFKNNNLNNGYFKFDINIKDLKLKNNKQILNKIFDNKLSENVLNKFNNEINIYLNLELNINDQNVKLKNRVNFSLKNELNIKENSVLNFNYKTFELLYNEQLLSKQIEVNDFTIQLTQENDLINDFYYQDNNLINKIFNDKIFNEKIKDLIFNKKNKLELELKKFNFKD